MATYYDIQLLIAARLRRGWDQTALAYHVGLSVAQVCRIEKGHFAKPATIRRIAEELEVSMEELVKEDNVDRVILTVELQDHLHELEERNAALEQKLAMIMDAIQGSIVNSNRVEI